MRNILEACEENFVSVEITELHSLEDQPCIKLDENILQITLAQSEC